MPRLSNQGLGALAHFLPLSFSACWLAESSGNQSSEKKGKIKMDLWELPPINPSKVNSANGFAESSVWLPEQDSNLRQGG